MTRVWPQPLIAVADVVASSAFYCELLGAASGHGGDEYEQIVLDGEFLLQLHKLDVEDHHGLIGDPGAPVGNGVLIWFEVADIEAAIERARALGAPIDRGPETNPNALQTELWLRDPDGYRVVLAGPSAYRPR